MNAPGNAYVIRQATVGDAAIVARHRVGMFCNMGQVPTQALADELLRTSTAELDVLLGDGSYRGWLAVEQERVLAGVGVHVLVLHASDAGLPLYRSLGFLPTNEMRWSIDSAEPGEN